MKEKPGKAWWSNNDLQILIYHLTELYLVLLLSICISNRKSRIGQIKRTSLMNIIPLKWELILKKNSNSICYKLLEWNAQFACKKSTFPRKSAAVKTPSAPTAFRSGSELGTAVLCVPQFRAESHSITFKRWCQLSLIPSGWSSNLNWPASCLQLLTCLCWLRKNREGVKRSNIVCLSKIWVLPKKNLEDWHCK